MLKNEGFLLRGEECTLCVFVATCIIPHESPEPNTGNSSGEHECLHFWTFHGSYVVDIAIHWRRRKGDSFYKNIGLDPKPSSVVLLLHGPECGDGETVTAMDHTCQHNYIAAQ